jgi:hypothetical protein
MATLKSKQTSITTVRYHLLPVASLLIPLIFHYPLPLNDIFEESSTYFRDLSSCKIVSNFCAFLQDNVAGFLGQCASHRVDRVLSFFSSRPNWDSPNPSPAGECVPPFGSGGTPSRGERGWGVPIPTRGQTLWYSRYICTLGY